jgi:hypothetical protein
MNMPTTAFNKCTGGKKHLQTVMCLAKRQVPCQFATSPVRNTLDAIADREKERNYRRVREKSLLVIYHKNSF